MKLNIRRLNGLPDHKKDAIKIGEKILEKCANFNDVQLEVDKLKKSIKNKAIQSLEYRVWDFLNEALISLKISRMATEKWLKTH